MTRNRVIGKDNQLPWQLPDDMAHFRRVTSSHAILMGRGTFESMNCRPLPNRLNIVLTSRSFDVSGVVYVNSLEIGIREAKCRGYEKCFVIGGSGVYKEALDVADVLYFTSIEAELDGDVYFPELDLDGWSLMSSKIHPADEKHPYAFTMNVYRRQQHLGVGFPS